MSIKLSICIPTYNRAQFLGQALKNIIAQATDEVEITVSDNASPDQTEEVVRSYQKQFPRLMYFRQSENLGPYWNFRQAVANATGEFCWLFGDDDLLEEGAISRLLNTYLAQPVDFVQSAVTVYDFQMKKVLGRSTEALGVTEDIYTTDTLSFFARFFQESYLSGFIVKREKWNSVDPAKYIGVGLFYLANVYEYLEIDSPVQFVAQPLVKYRSGNNSWSSATLDIVVRDMNYVLDSLPMRYDPAKPEAKRHYEQRVPVTMAMLAFLRADGHYDLARYRKYIHNYFAGRPVQRTLSRLLAVTPQGILRTARTLSQKRPGRNKG